MLKTKLLLSCIVVTLTPHMITCAQAPSRSSTPLDERDWLDVQFDKENENGNSFCAVEIDNGKTAPANAQARAATPPLQVPAAFAAALILAPAALPAIQQAGHCESHKIDIQTPAPQEDPPVELQILLNNIPMQHQQAQPTDNNYGKLSQASAASDAVKPLELSVPNPRDRKPVQQSNPGAAVLQELYKPEEVKIRLNWQLRCLNCLNCCKPPKSCVQIKCRKSQCACAPEKCVVL